MFCALKGVTRNPRWAKMRHNAVVIMLLPTSDPVPNTAKHAALLATQTSDSITPVAPTYSDRAAPIRSTGKEPVYIPLQD